MGLCYWAVFGFFAGLLARAILPGKQSLGIIATTLLGIAGSFVGGVIASLMAGRNPMHFESSGMIGSIIGALIILAIGEGLKKRSG